MGDGEKLAMVVDGTAEHALQDSYEGERRPVAANVPVGAGDAGPAWPASSSPRS